MLALPGGLQLVRQAVVHTTTCARRSTPRYHASSRGVVAAAAAQPVPSGGESHQRPAEACHLRYVVGLDVEDTSGAREALRCHSGASRLLDVMKENLVAVDLYRHWGKV